MDEWVMERYELAKERIAQIPQETIVEEPYRDFFVKEAAFLQQIITVMDNGTQGKNFVELKVQNHELYQDILPQNYENSYGNPAYAQKMLGEYGKVFTFLYTELHGGIAYAFEKKAWDLTVILELFLEIYSAFAQEEIPTEKQVKEILVSYVNDYCQDMVEERIREAIDPENNFIVKLIMESDLNDLSYLYQSGEYVSENELKTAEFMNSLSQKEIDDMARTYTEGYRIGFITGRKDITRKKTVNIRYHLGFERMVKAAICQFEEMGLKTVIYRHAFKNALIPLVTLLGLYIPSLFSGAMILESVFLWPGLGKILIEAISGQDQSIITACLMFSAILMVLGNLLSDILYSVVDPRVKVE